MRLNIVAILVAKIETIAGKPVNPAWIYIGILLVFVAVVALCLLGIIPPTVDDALADAANSAGFPLNLSPIAKLTT